MAQLWARASRAYDVSDQRRHIGACDMRRTVKYRFGPIVLHALRKQLTPTKGTPAPTSMCPGNSGPLHDLAPALDFRADERLQCRGRLTDDGQHSDVGELLLDLRHRHDN